MTPQPFTYNAKIVSVHDGDTATAEIDLGFTVRITLPLRLNGINAPELNTPAGKAAAAWLKGRLSGANVIIQTVKDKREKYGRYLATVWIGAENINEALVAAGHAKHWNGKGARP